jgi:crotonobetainyl-CoA:carnitine CoA-transferase CaiB-like acyl-CoA transferase
MVATTRSTPSALLRGVRVLDLTDGRGELCGRFLADLGADVVLVEPPGGAASRAAQPIHDGISLYFETHQANKRGIALDLGSDEGREALLSLVGQADILIESGDPGELARLGRGPAQLRERNPALVVTSITNFGQDGPYRDYAATSLVHMSLNAVLARSGKPGRRPLPPPGELAWETSAIQAAWATLLAYANAAATGRGDHVDVSLYETSLEVFDPGYGVAGSARANVAPGDFTERDRPDQGHLYPIMPCADGYVRICLLAPRQWRGMWRWMGSPEELGDERYDQILIRFAEWPDLAKHIEAFFADKTRAELAAEAPAYNVPLAELLSPTDVLAGEHFRERAAFAPIQLANGQSGLLANGFVAVDGERAGIRSGAPGIGEHGSGADGGALFAEPRPAPLAEALSSDPARPLQGLKVLDLGVIVVGAEVPRLFADMGADVIKLENKSFPDGMRQTPPGEAITASFAWGHRNKQSLGLDLRSPEGIETFKQLAAHADIVHSNFKPGTMESLGIGFDVLRTINPWIVMAESSAMGSTGPWSKRLGYGPLVRASTGLTGLWRYPEPDGPFCDAVTVYPDHANARVEAAAVLAAVLRARRTGQGAQLSLAQTETMFGQMATQYLRESLEPGTFVPMGNASEFDAPFGAYPCAGDDEWCAIEVRTDEQWRALAEIAGRPELANDSAYATSAARSAHRDQVDALVIEWTAQHGPVEVMQLLQARRVPAGAMWRVSDLLDDPHLKARGFWREMVQPQIAAPLPTENGPASFDVIADPPVRPAPMQAQHSREILHRWLDLDDAAIDALVAVGAVEERPAD